MWDQSDLIRRVCSVVDFAGQVLSTLTGAVRADRLPADSPSAVIPEKVIAEAAMLLHAAASIQELDGRLHGRVQDLAARLMPLARDESMLVSLCTDPGLAFERSVAHAVLSKLGFEDPRVDRLLQETTSLGARFGPEQLPFLELERDWLGRVWKGVPGPAATNLLAQSTLGRQLDVLGATRLDVYAFTHAVMYASDFGAAAVALPRRASAIAADAEAALALSLEADDFDVICEVTMTWPMLHLEWSAAARFAFGLLIEAHDREGFLPGPAFDPDRCRSRTPQEQPAYVVETSYHTTFVMGMLCAAAVRRGCLPPLQAPIVDVTGAASAILKLSDGENRHTRWRQALDTLSSGAQDALAPLLVSASLRGAKEHGDLARIRRVLEAVLAHGLFALPAVRQSADLLRRSAILDAIIHPVNA
ncbi:MAG: hypothetical protein ABJC89_06155 [Acidobacteriota bacterium]